jgi:CNT family concentrative nucleoside transporter
MDRFFGLLGIALIFGLAFLLSNNRKAINYKTVGMGFLLQVALAVFVFKVPVGQMIFMKIGMFIAKILEFSLEGGRLVFGGLMENYVFALQLVSSLIFMMILVNILYYYGIMQRVVLVLGRAMNKLMSVSGAEALSNAASAFVGQVVAQIMIKPYLAKLTRSELLASMAGSMA